MTSEFSRLVQQIDNEAIAMCRGMYGLAQGTARHDFIEARFKAIEEAREELIQHVGSEQETDEMVADLLDSIIVLCACEHDLGVVRQDVAATIARGGK